MNGVIVTECHEPFWEIFEEKNAGFGFSLGTIFKFIIAQIKLMWKYITKIPDHDIVMVGFIGQMDMFLAKALAWLTGRKLVFNPLVSIYDTVVGDRQFVNPNSMKAKIFRWLDKTTGKMADAIFLDTDTHIDYFCHEFDLPREKFHRIWVGADETIFTPLEITEKAIPNFEVLFIGKFIPLHGLPKIVQTAKLLQSDPHIHFTLVGQGQLRPSIDRQIEAASLSNISVIDWIPYEDLAAKMSEADLILGIFGDSDKAHRVIPNKVYQGLAVGQAVMTMDSPASRELLTHGKNVWLVENTPEKMAEAVTYLTHSPSELNKIRHGALELSVQNLTQSALGNEITKILELLK